MLAVFWGTKLVLYSVILLLHSLCTFTRPNSSQLFPNLEATCNILLFLSTPIPQGTKLSGLLMLWLTGAWTRNFSVKNMEIGTIISFFKWLLDTLAWLTSSYRKVTLLYWRKQEWGCPEREFTDRSPVLIFHLNFGCKAWTLKKKSTKCEFSQDALLIKCC